jgi:hypothetical protein
LAILFGVFAIFLGLPNKFQQGISIKQNVFHSQPFTVSFSCIAVAQRWS